MNDEYPSTNDELLSPFLAGYISGIASAIVVAWLILLLT